jgi:quinol-cytochrome oxidoreductase complex cytochrome b subunit
VAVGGGEACSTALVRFYTWHIFGLTILAVILAFWHAFRVRRDGGIALPPPHLRMANTRISRNELVRREGLAMLLVGALLILLASLLPAPIAPAMTETPVLTAEARAPWFFLWVQQMLKWGDPFLWGVVIPLALLTVLGLIPYVFPGPVGSDIGRWFPKSNRLAQAAAGGVALLVIVLTLLSLLPA